MVKGGKGPGGIVGISYATRALGIADKATLAAWIKNRPTYQKRVQLAVTVSGTKGEDEGHEKVIGRRRETAFSCRGRASNGGLDHREFHHRMWYRQPFSSIAERRFFWCHPRVLSVGLSITGIA